MNNSTKNINLKKIIDYIKPTGVYNCENAENIEVAGISYNSKTLEKGNIFVCIKGEHTDGHNFLEDAYNKGASAIISEKADKELPQIGIPILQVEKTHIALAKAAAVLYGFPSKKINLIGVTGTNGKTTVTHLIQNIFEKASKKCALVGTLGSRLSSLEKYVSSGHTTPQANELQKTLEGFLQEGILNAAMEVSSHSIEQNRVAECVFSTVVLTNLTQDHLDYHITMENYFNEKRKLFSGIGNNPPENAIINKDDDYSERFISAIHPKTRLITYAINNEADIKAKNIQFSQYGSKFEISSLYGNFEIKLQMAGMFSVYNALAALCAGIAEKIDINSCIEALENTSSVAGRFEAVSREPLVIVDYAHTPDGLENVLNTAKEIVPEGGGLICVFGCGGDRDATKRPKMGRIAELICDRIIITSDNPRSEDPQQIITDILSGIKSLSSTKTMVEPDRRIAIQKAVEISRKNDVLVIAGKGHEDYQILKDRTVHFDDREEAVLALQAFSQISN